MSKRYQLYPNRNRLWYQELSPWQWAMIAFVCLIGLIGWSAYSRMTPNLINYSSSILSGNRSFAKPSPIGISQSYGIATANLTSMNNSQLMSYLGGVAATGAKWIRFDFDWSQIQPNNAESYNWAAYDRVVAASTSLHLQILGILDYTPAWARPSNCQSSNKCHPASNQQFAKFAAATAAHYALKGVNYWEIWNEPNNPEFWQPSPNPQQYTSLLQATAKAIWAVDSQDYILTGGLAPQATTQNSYSPPAFLKAIYHDGAKNYFNGVADHPYTYPQIPSNTTYNAWSQMAGQNDSLRSIMIANGDRNLKIWITEFGSPTSGAGNPATIYNLNSNSQANFVSLALQAQILSQAIKLYRQYSWAGPFIYYTYQDGPNSTTTNQNSFGLITYNGQPKPVYNVFKAAALAADH